MSLLLHIVASPRAQRSCSQIVADTLVKAYLEAHPNTQLKTLNLWNTALPPFDGGAIDAKYALASGRTVPESAKKAWLPVEQLIDEFKSADLYLFSIPMWNFSIPYVLKHYIDLIVQPSYTFSFDPKTGYTGLVKGKRAVLVLARSGQYTAGTGMEAYDYQDSYMRLILQFIGFQDIDSIFVENTTTAKEAQVSAAKEKAIAWVQSTVTNGNR